MIDVGTDRAQVFAGRMPTAVNGAADARISLGYRTGLYALSELDAATSGESPSATACRSATCASGWPAS